MVLAMTEIQARINELAETKRHNEVMELESQAKAELAKAQAYKAREEGNMTGLEFDVRNLEGVYGYAANKLLQSGWNMLSSILGTVAKMI